MKGSVNRRTNKFQPTLDSDDRPVFTKSLLVTFVSTTDKFECPLTLNSSRLQDWKKAKASLQLVDGTDYVLSEDSINEFPSTDTKPQAVSATYRPAAVFVE